MARKRRRRLLVPEARDALERLKMDVMGVAKPEDAAITSAQQQNIPLQPGDNGQLTAREAGKIGGPIGGQMVKKLIALAQMQMINEQHREQNRPHP
ncbi:alpha/beta-type small acid-soluble spore protein [Tumebacillus permanentifrigoris]|uniref:Small acid-soluble spore protein alpha/beta type n=1 Tax=Tumebacillus permanentifrigoris TaxID=378543 RepID=A0A316D6Y9_9BACL|nr:alpha/beta-type small acid-soluble spore protein [Tumebacillus permanentifrigoris]PWK08377.1 small acid-soluble spore protein alpha/beta type [Tumebacillus permanentifrigoris]